MDKKTTAIVPQTLNRPAQAITTLADRPTKRITNGFGAEIAELIHLSGTIELTAKQEKTLFVPVNEKDVEIRPDGLIYLPWMEYVTRLKEVFGMRWTLLPEGLPKTAPNGNSIMWGFWLVIDGKPYGFAIGEQEYYPENKTMSWSDACEGAKSNALMRLCKGIGISLELWRPSFMKAWKKKYAHQVLAKDRYGNPVKDNYGRPKMIWQKKGQEKSAEEERAQQDMMPKEEEIKEASNRPAEPKTGQKTTAKPAAGPKGGTKNRANEQGKEPIKPVKDKMEAVIENIKTLLAKKTFDPKHFKIFLYDFAKDHKVKFVELNRFNNLSFHDGDYDDLCKLVTHFDYMSGKYLEWVKLYQPRAKEPLDEKEQEEEGLENGGPEEDEDAPL